MSRTTYQAKCHCGAIAYRYTTKLPVEQWSLRSCQCSFCRSHGACCTSDPAGSVEIFAQDDAALLRYCFGLKTAEFFVCRHCGVYIAAVLISDEGTFATLNVNVMTPTPNPLPAAQPMTYESETPDQRIQRRKQRWTPAKIVIGQSESG